MRKQSFLQGTASCKRFLSPVAIKANSHNKHLMHTSAVENDGLKN